MIILPAIDLLDGNCVRLRKGAYETAERVAEDAVLTARAFYEAGARMIHVVDLDAAKDGVGKNYDTVRAIIKKTGAAVELGGGIRNMESLSRVFELGVSRAIIGSAAVKNPEFVKEAVAEYGDKIAVGIDAKNGTVRTDGWLSDSSEDALTFAKKMEAYGVRTIIYTDIEKDGMLSGPAFESLYLLNEAVSCDIVASGGIADYDDLRALSQRNIYGAIVGRAYYAGRIDIKKAIEEVSQA